MNNSQHPVIEEYNTLINNLNPMGKHQMLLYSICVCYWILAGCYKTTFELAYKAIECQYALSFFQFIGILLFCYFGTIKNRKWAIAILGFSALIGLAFCTIAVNSSHLKILGTLGISTIGLSIYSQPCLLLCIISEMSNVKITHSIVCASLFCFCCTKIAMIPLINHLKDDSEITYFILAPACALSFSLSFLIDESPRSLIENDILKAEILIRKIAKRNNLLEEQIMYRIDEGFIMKKINIRKYSYLTLIKFNSLGLSQHCLVISMLLLGMTSKYPNYILSLKTSLINEQIQIVWITCFQIFGVIISVFFLRISNRRIVCLVSSLIISIVSSTLFFIYRQSIHDDLVLLALNAVFAMLLFIFLLVNAIEFYPHSIRTLGLGMTLSAYYLGQFLFLSYEILNPLPNQLLQFFLLSSWVMFAHTFGIQETAHKGFAYEISEIQQEENEQF